MQKHTIRPLAIVAALVVGLAGRPGAQLLQPNADGLSMGLVMLNVTDVAAHTRSVPLDRMWSISRRIAPRYRPRARRSTPHTGRMRS